MAMWRQRRLSVLTVALGGSGHAPDDGLGCVPPAASKTKRAVRGSLIAGS